MRLKTVASALVFLAVVLTSPHDRVVAATVKPDVAAIHSKVQALLRAGKVDGALQAALNELDLANARYGLIDERTALAFDDAGRAFAASGIAAGAEVSFRKAIEVQAQLPKTSANIRTMVMYELDYGGLLNQAERFAEAETYLFAASVLLQKVKPRDESLAVAVAVTYATTEYHVGKTEAARGFAEAVVKRYAGERPDANLRIALTILGQIAANDGQYGDAEVLYTRAYKIREKGDENNSTYAGELAAGGQAYLADAVHEQHPEKLNVAERLLKQAVAVYARDPASLSGVDRYYVEEQLAELYGVEGRDDQSMATFKNVLGELHDLFDERFLFMSENDRLAMASGVSIAFDQFYVLSWNDRNARDTVGPMDDVVLWHKGQVLRSIESLRAAVTAAKDAESTKLLSDISREREGIADATVEHGGDTPKLVALLDTENNDEQSLARRLLGKSVNLKRKAPTWEDVRARLGPDEAAVEFVDAGKGYFALILTAHGHGLQYLGAEERVNRDAVAAFSQEVKNPQSRPNPSFYDIVWKPIVDPALRNIKRVYVSADGALNQIPFDVVRDDDGNLLMDDYDIRMVSSTAVLAVNRPVSSSNRAYLFGDPTYYPGDSAASTACNGDTGGRAGERIGARVASLPCTRDEIDGVRKELQRHGMTVTTEMGSDASESMLKGVTGARILHIASHGFVFPDSSAGGAERFGTAGAATYQDPMFRSGLILAGGGPTWEGQPPTKGADDGILTAYEAASLDLQGNELVVLSACDSGLGSTTSGEGVFGLQRAFAEAGAHMILMSMWEVPDRETQELLDSFYERWLGGEDAPSALHDAERSEREIVRQRYNQDLPFYWGAFVLVTN